MKYEKEYVAPTLTIDGVIFQIINNELNVLLIKRRSEPFKGQYALPGGYNPEGETTLDALKRIMKTKTGIDVNDMGLVEQLYTFDAVGRDPRGHAVSVVYMLLGTNIAIEVGADTEQPEFFPITSLPELAYDHAAIVRMANERLISKLNFTNAIYALIPKRFTLTELQLAYESILGRQLDKRNFRKRFLALDLLKDEDEYKQEGAHRPAKLYSFKNQKQENLSNNLVA